MKALSKIHTMFPKYHFYHNHYEELYRISKDVYEKDNVISIKSKVAKRISTLSPLKGKYPASFTNENPIDDETLKLLKSLGYVQ